MASKNVASQLFDADCLERPALEVAPMLLGAVLCVGGRSGVIVETEAYGGSDDPASHAFAGQTKRNRSMFGPPGVLYVYLIYGIHWCANVVCGSEGEGSAVLVRALEPVAGIEEMRASRPQAKKLTELCSGPGKLTASLEIDRRYDGVDLTDPANNVQLLIGQKVLSVTTGPRVGITKAVEFPWRFGVEGNPHISRPF